MQLKKQGPRLFGEVQMKWLPIESAPPDGTPVLACSIGYGRATGLGLHPFTAVYSAFHPNAPGKKCWRDINGHRRAPTHWMPLPKGPKK
jgi:hypothetical protein